MKGFVVNGERYTRNPAKLRADHTGGKNVIMADTPAPHTPLPPRRPPPDESTPSPGRTPNQTEPGSDQSMEYDLCIQATKDVQMLGKWIKKLETDVEHQTKLNEKATALNVTYHGVMLEQSEKIASQGEEILKLYITVQEQEDFAQLQHNEIIALRGKVQDLEGKDTELEKLQKDVELERQTKEVELERRHNERSDAGRFEL